MDTKTEGRHLTRRRDEAVTLCGNKPCEADKAPRGSILNTLCPLCWGIFVGRGPSGLE